MPSYPPISPITTSHFAMWSLFDGAFGQSHETIGTCCLRIAGLERGIELAHDAANLLGFEINGQTRHGEVRLGAERC